MFASPFLFTDLRQLQPVFCSLMLLVLNNDNSNDNDNNNRSGNSDNPAHVCISFQVYGCFLIHA